jgi:hypothetical protein
MNNDLHALNPQDWAVLYFGQTKLNNSCRRTRAQIIGLAHQEYYARIPKPESKNHQDSKNRKKRTRESQLWERSGISIGNAPNQASVRWVRVADRGVQQDGTRQSLVVQYEFGKQIQMLECKPSNGCCYAIRT